MRRQPLAPCPLPDRGVVGAVELLVGGLRMALQQQQPAALELGTGHHAPQLPVVAEVLERGQRLEGAADVAAVEGHAPRIMWSVMMWSGTPTSQASGR